MKSFLGLACLALVLAACTQTESPAPMALEYPDRPNALKPATPVFTWPGSWEYRLDEPSEELVVTGDSAVADPDVYFTNMTPGWHVTMNHAAGIFWHPSSTAEGDYQASATIYLFNPGDLNEGYGIIVGGSDLAGDDQRYLYFLARRTGEFLVKERKADRTSVVVDWTANAAVAAWTPESVGTIENNFSVQVSGDMVSFILNGIVVHSMEKGTLPLDGLVGLRLNHATNVHVSSLTVAMGSDEMAADSTMAMATN